MIKELKNLREKYCDCVSQRPMFFNSLDVPDTYKKDIDKYRYYETSMDYLVGIIKNANRITQRKYDKSKIPLYELFKETKNGKRDFRQIYKINEIIASYKKENNKLWNDTNMSNSEKYFTSLDMRENLINHISKIKINETTIYRILKNVSNTQQILMISILFNSYKNIFLSLIKEKKSDIHNLFLYENGDISIYGLKFSKK